MPLWCGIVGSLLFAGTFYDISWTTLSASETGPLSLGVVFLFKAIGHFFRTKIRMYRFLHGIGLVTFLFTIMIWYLLFWMSWALIFLTTSDGIVESKTGRNANPIEVIYYAGFVIFTLGIGDYRPNGGVYMILTSFAAGCGFFLVSISAAYLLSATDAIIRQRQLAGHISAIGGSPTQIIINAYNKKDISSLDSYIQTIAADIIRCGQQILCFPLIFNFYSLELVYSSAIRIAALDETLTMIECCLPENMQLSHFCVNYMKSAVVQYLNALKVVKITCHDSYPKTPIPDVQALINYGIPVVSTEIYTAKYNDIFLVKRRKLLHSMVLDSGRKWCDVTLFRVNQNCV